MKLSLARSFCLKVTYLVVESGQDASTAQCLLPMRQDSWSFIHGAFLQPRARPRLFSFFLSFAILRTLLARAPFFCEEPCIRKTNLHKWCLRYRRLQVSRQFERHSAIEQSFLQPDLLEKKKKRCGGIFAPDSDPLRLVVHVLQAFIQLFFVSTFPFVVSCLPSISYAFASVAS